MTDIAARHAALAERFTKLAEGVSDWNAPTPVAEWVARDIIDHLISWPPAMLAGMGVELPAVEPTPDPLDGWRAHTANMQALLDDQDSVDRLVETADGSQPLSQVIDNYYLADIFMHSWDLAKASGQDADLDPQIVAAMVMGMSPMADSLAASGQFGQPKVLDESHSDLDRLIALIGRDPAWTPGS